MTARSSRTASACPWWTSVGVCRPRPLCRCSSLYQGKKVSQWARAASIVANRAGKSGRYFQGLELRLGKGIVIRHVNPPGFAGDSVSWEGWGHVEKIWELPEGAAGPCCSDGGGGSVGACFGVGGH